MSPVGEDRMQEIEKAYKEGLDVDFMVDRDEVISLIDQVQYALGALRMIASGDCSAGNAKAVAQSGLDLMTLGESVCAKMRGDAP